MPNLAPLTKKFCELLLFLCRLSSEGLQFLLSFLLALYRATWSKKNEIILKRVSVKRGVRVIFFFREGCFSAKIRLGLTALPHTGPAPAVPFYLGVLEGFLNLPRI